jgi:uncharacterized protein YbjQ (UPF0145 family)
MVDVEAKGGNAVLCTRFVINSAFSGCVEVLAYGTAVVLEPSSGPGSK